MSVELHVGSGGDHQPTKHLRAYLKRAHWQPDGSPGLLYIVADHLAAERSQELLSAVRDCGRWGLFSPPVVTVGEFVRSHCNTPIASTSQRRQVVRQLLTQLPAGSPFALSAHTSGVVEGLERCVGELDEHGLRCGQELIAALGPSRTVQALAEFFDQVRTRLAALGLCTSRAASAEVAEAIGRGEIAIARTVIVDNVADPSGQWQPLWRAAAKEAENVVGIFATEPAEPSLEFWRTELGAKLMTASARTNLQRSAALSCHSELSGVREADAAARFLYHAHSADPIAVCAWLVATGAEASAAEHALTQLSVPHRCAVPRPLSQCQPARALLAALQRASGHPDTQRLHTALCTPLFSLLEPGGGRRCATTLSVESLTAQPKTERREHAPEHGLLTALAALSQVATPRQHGDNVRALLNQLGVGDYQRHGSPGVSETAETVAAAVARVLTSTTQELETLHPEAMPWSYFLAHLSDALGGSVVEDADHRAPVTIMTFAQAVGRQFDHLVVSGLECIGAQRTHNAWLLTDTQRARLGLPTEAHRATKARAQVLAAVANTGKHALLTFCRPPGTDLHQHDQGPGDIRSAPHLRFVLEHADLGLYADPAGPLSQQLWQQELARTGSHSQARATAELANPIRAAAMARAFDCSRARSAEADLQLSAFDGKLSPQSLRLLEASGRLAQLSVSTLNTYLRCPYQAFAKVGLGLSAQEDEGADDGARQIGTFTHRVLDRFVAATPPELRADTPGACHRMREIAEDERARRFANHALLLARARDLEAGLQGDTTWGPLRAFIAREQARPPFACAQREHPIALAISVPGSQAIRLSGVVDRIDCAPDGSLAIYDYKSGRKAPTLTDILQGCDLQLVSYGLATRATTQSPGPIAALAYYPVSGGNAQDHRTGIADARYLEAVGAGKRRWHVADMDTFLDRGREALEHAANALTSGHFHPGTLPPARKGCSHCPFKRLCRVDHARLEALEHAGCPDLFIPMPLEDPCRD